MEPREHTRRGFLDILLGLATAGWLGSIAYPILSYLRPLPAEGPTGPVRLTDEEKRKLEQHQFVIVPMAGARVLVLQDGSSKLHALSARCTHEGCTVQYVTTESIIWCACHNARFDLDGRVLSGPPPKPLPQYVVKRDDDGEVLIVKETA